MTQMTMSTVYEHAIAAKVLAAERLIKMQVSCTVAVRVFSEGFGSNPEQRANVSLSSHCPLRRKAQ